MTKIYHQISIEQKAHNTGKIQIQLECPKMTYIEVLKLLKDTAELYTNITRVELTSEYIDVTLDI